MDVCGPEDSLPEQKDTAASPIDDIDHEDEDDLGFILYELASMHASAGGLQAALQAGQNSYTTQHVHYSTYLFL